MTFNNDLKADSVVKTENADLSSANDKRKKKQGVESEKIMNFISEHDLIERIEKLNSGKTRNDLAKTLVFAFVILLLILSLMHVLAKKEIIDELVEFSQYAITTLGNLTAVAIGYYFRKFND